MADGPKHRVSIGARRNPETEAAVLLATEALIAESGYAALTMEAVAKRSQAGKATLYRWWPSKAYLVLALVSRAKLDLEAPETGSLRGDLLTFFVEMMDLWRGATGQMPLGPLVRVLYFESASDPAFAARFQDERRLRWLVLDMILDAALARGEVSSRLTMARAKELTMALPIFRLMQNDLPAPDQVAAMVDDILPGLTH